MYICILMYLYLYKHTQDRTASCKRHEHNLGHLRYQTLRGRERDMVIDQVQDCCKLKNPHHAQTKASNKDVELLLLRQHCKQTCTL